MAGHTLSYMATLNSSGFMTGLNQMLSGLGGFSGSLNRLKSTLSGLTPLLTNPFVLGATAVAGIGVAIGTAVGNFASFDDQMRKVAAVTRTSMEDMESLTDKARELGATTKFTGEEVGQGMQYLGMAGFSKEEIEGSIGATLNLAQSTGSGLGETADIMSNIMSTFKMGAEDSGHAADVLALTTASANTDLQQLGDSMKYVGPVAQSMGMSFEEAAAATGFLSNVGIQASMAGTTLRGALSRLNDAAPKEVFDTLDKYGLSMEQVSAESHNFTDILQTLHDAGMSTGDMLKLMGLRAGPGMLELISQGKDPLNEYIESLKNADGTAQQMADTMEGGLGGALRSFKSRISSLSQGQFISDVANNVVAPLIRGVTSGIGTVQNLFGNIYKGIKTSDLAASIGKMFSGVSKYMASGAGTLSKLFDPIKQSIEKVFGEEAIGKGIGALFNHLTDGAEVAFEVIGKGFELLAAGAESLGPVFETVGKGIGEAVEWAGALAKTIKEYASGSSTIQKIGDAFEKLKSPIETIKTAWEGFTNAMPNAVSGAVSAIQTLFQKFFDWLDEKLNIGDTIKEKLGIGEGGFIDTLLKNKEEIENVGKEVGQEFTEEALAQTDKLAPGIEEDLMNTDAGAAGRSKGTEFVENFEESLSAMELADYYSDVGGTPVMGEWNIGSEIGDSGYSFVYRKKYQSSSDKSRVGIVGTSGKVQQFDSWKAAKEYLSDFVDLNDELLNLQSELSREMAGLAARELGFSAERVNQLQLEIDTLLEYRDNLEKAFNEGIILNFDKAWEDFSEDAANVFSDNLVSGVEASNMIERLTTLKSTDKDAFEKMGGESAIEWWNGLEALIEERSETLAIDPNADVSKMDEQIREYLKDNPYTVELTGEITDIFGNVEPEQLMFNFAENWEDNVKKIKEDVTDWNLFRENVALPALKQSLEHEKQLLSTGSEENYKVVNDYIDDLVKLYGEMPEAFGKAEIELINSLQSAAGKGSSAQSLIDLIDKYLGTEKATDDLADSTKNLYNEYNNLDECISSTFSTWRNQQPDMFYESIVGSTENYIKRVKELAELGRASDTQIEYAASLNKQSVEEFLGQTTELENAAEIDAILETDQALTDAETLESDISAMVPEMEVSLLTTNALLDAQSLFASIERMNPHMQVSVDISANAGQIAAIAQAAVRDAIASAYSQ